MFYYISQNGNGGFFVEDLKKGICEDIIIEAHSAADAVAKLLTIGESVAGFYDNNSSVCGERWELDIRDSDGTTEPRICGKKLNKVKQTDWRKKCILHWIDGSIGMVAFRK